jgi:preprotein translocase subunit SecE
MPTNPTIFAKEAVEEVKKVTWPTREEIIRLTVSVMIISAVIGIFLGGLDFLLTKLLEAVVK